MILKVKRLRDDARLPTRSHADDAGLDLYDPTPVADGGLYLRPGETATVPLGIALELPADHFGLLRERSGHALQGIHVLGGVIDSGYRGEVVLVLHHAGNQPIYFPPGGRLAQLLILPVPYVTLVETDDLSPASRGTAGFGSTGG